tara:strand:+ start:25 stop:198 length:174 start_codon:yes stop_codon:yes gene_type:complete
MPIVSVKKQKMAKRGAIVGASFVVVSSLIFFLASKELGILIAVLGSYVPSTWNLLDG